MADAVRLIGRVELDSGGISAILSGGEVTAMVNLVANQIAAGTRALIPADARHSRIPGAGVFVEPYQAGGGRLIGSRSAARIVVTYPDAAALQARYGILTKPVAALGLRVTRKR